MVSDRRKRLITGKLDLIAATYDLVCAEIEDPVSLAALLGVSVEAGWPPGEYDRDAQLYFRDRLREGGDSVVGWYGWYAIVRSEAEGHGVLIGSGGFLGPPGVEGEVEIGYSIMPAWVGLGYATDMVQALTVFAWRDTRIKRIMIRTAATNHASQRVIEKCGFTFEGEDEKTGTLCFIMKKG